MDLECTKEPPSEIFSTLTTRGPRASSYQSAGRGAGRFRKCGMAEGKGFELGGANVCERSPVFKTSDLLQLTTLHQRLPDLGAVTQDQMIPHIAGHGLRARDGGQPPS